VIIANAYRDAQQIRGRGDAHAAEIYADAYSKDEEFYAFYRSLQAYQQSFQKGNDLLLLQPEGEFFDYFNGAQGK
jgi:membrane protease subunit HflC